MLLWRNVPTSPRLFLTMNDAWFGPNPNEKHNSKTYEKQA